MEIPESRQNDGTPTETKSERVVLVEKTLIDTFAEWIVTAIAFIVLNQDLDKMAIRHAYKAWVRKYPPHISRMFYACYTLLQRRIYCVIVMGILATLWIDLQREFFWPLLWNNQTGVLFLDPLNWSNHGLLLFGTTMRTILWASYWVVVYSFTIATTIAGTISIPIVAEMLFQFFYLPSNKKLIETIAIAYSEFHQSRNVG